MSEELEVLVGRVHALLELKLLLVVVGWRAEDHVPFTLGIPGKQVQFLDADAEVPANAGLILMLGTVGQKEVKRIRSVGKPVHRLPLRSGEVMRVLDACKEFFPPLGPADPPEQPIIETVRVKDAGKEMYMSVPPIDRFKMEFRKQAGPEGQLIAQRVAKLCKELGLDGARSLVNQGVIQPHKREGGERISYYTLADAAALPAVTDPTLSEVQLLLNQEPQLRAERAQIEAERAEMEARYRTRLEVLDKKLALLDGLNKSLRNIKQLLGEE